MHIPLADADPEVAMALADEVLRQDKQFEMIASENIVSRAVREALGHEINNKTLEGYPGARFHGGGENVDVIENLARQRARELFEARYVNVQPHSGTQANQAALMALAKPGDSILSLDLASGGHLSHGAKANLSSRIYEVHHYGVSPDTGLIDMDEVADRAIETRPVVLIAGGSAYPRIIDFEAMGQIATNVGASFMVDMAHIAGLVAGGAHPSPMPHADVVTCTTTKTLRGPRGGIIMSRSEELARRLDSAVFPGVQGSLHPNVLAAKAVCLGEALQHGFKDYALQVVSNAKRLAEVLQERGIKLVTGGTDTHMVLLDLSGTGMNGSDGEKALAEAGITSNRNPVPFDPPRPAEWTGLRLGVAAVTTRGYGLQDMERLGNVIAAQLGMK